MRIKKNATQRDTSLMFCLLASGHNGLWTVGWVGGCGVEHEMRLG